MKPSLSFDITVVVNAHREGLLLLPSLRSAALAVAHAERAHLQCEVIVALDRPDALTAELAASQPPGGAAFRCLSLDLGDLGESRNAAVRQARGTYVAFLDGDDLWSENWLTEALVAASLDDRLLVLHPAANFYFGHDPHVFVHADMDDPSFDLSVLALANLWTSLCFAPRELLRRCPYPHTDLANQIGYEDWGWNMRAIAAGATHKAVPGTLHAIRSKPVSLLRQTTAAGCFPAYPEGLFRNARPEAGDHAASPQEATGHG